MQRLAHAAADERFNEAALTSRNGGFADDHAVTVWQRSETVRLVCQKELSGCSMA